MAASRGERRRMAGALLPILLLAMSALQPGAAPRIGSAPLRHGLINLAHLEFLTEPVRIAGQEMAIVHIYSEYPHYEWVDASGEGIACVDDSARAALVYLDFYERYHEPQALAQARRLLRFVMYMQAPDGEYYNFILDRTGQRNETGQTSFKSWGWWAARGQWALAAGYRVLRADDPAFAATLQAAYRRGEDALARHLTHYGQWESLHGVRVPDWLPGNGSDLAALAMLGLAEYQAAAPNPQTARLLAQLGEGVASYQLENFQQYPFGAFPSTTTSTALWHAWGSHQVEALAVAGRLLGRSEWIDAARQAADAFYVKLLVGDMVSEMAVIPYRPGQIAYGTEVVARGLWALYRATDDRRYARYAGLAASWLFGNNMAGFSMYDVATGRGYDGIQGANDLMVNRNAGAESTIEALLTLLPLADDPVATRYLQLREVQRTAGQVLEAEAAIPVAGRPEYGRRDWTGEARFSGGHYYALAPGDEVELPFWVAAGEYYVYLAYLRQAAPPPPRSLYSVRAAAPPSLDGDAAAWTGAPVIAVEGKENILRGAALWQGPAADSFRLQAMWDEQYLYLRAVVRGRHHQPDVGTEVWKGSALWLYMDTAGDHSRVDVKLTLAQTPKGPQVWDWRAGFFLPGASLQWRAVDGGYIYTAALPWRSLGGFRPAPGRRMNLEAGIGIGGGGFMDITGLDPDTAANLTPLDFVLTAPPQTGGDPRPSQAQFDVATAIRLDGQSLPLHAEAVSPDRDYLWLDKVTPLPVYLTAGEHRLLLAGAGRNPERRAVLDALWIVPVAQRKVLAGAGGLQVELEHFWDTGQTFWKEHE